MYGVIGCLGMVAALIILISTANLAIYDVPMIRSLKFPNPPVRVAQRYGVPAAFLPGPAVGILAGRDRQRTKTPAAEDARFG